MKTVLILAHDAGGAEILGALVAGELNTVKWTLGVKADSPAEKIFLRYGLKYLISVLPSSNDALYLGEQTFDLALIKLGWNEFPLNSLGLARSCARTTLVLLDHWGDYIKRFGKDDEEQSKNWPDGFVCCDNHAFNLCLEQGLKPVFPLKNYFVENLRQKFRATEGGDLLLLSQTVTKSEQRSGERARYTGQYTGSQEEYLLRDLAKYFPELRQKFLFDKLRIRLHPSEKHFRGTELLQSISSDLIIVEDSSDCDLAESLGRAKIVVGMNSMAVLLAQAVGIRVCSVIPGGLERTIPLSPANCYQNIKEFSERRTTLSDENDRNMINFFPQDNFDRFLNAVEISGA